MLLAIDVGNTQTVVGLFSDEPAGLPARPAPARPASAAPPEPAPPEPGLAEPVPGVEGLLESWRVTTVAERTAEEHALLLAQLLELAGVRLLRAPAGGDRGADHGRGRVDGVVVSSSVPPVTATLTETAERFFEAPLVVVAPGIRTGMPIRYENPREVGADRVTNAVAALDLYRPPLVVVDLGTATTFDAVSREGEYLGGAIAPGLDISMDALHAHAASLPRVALGDPRRAIGRTTIESMQSGAVFGHAGLVDAMCARLEEELGRLTVIATGGLAALVAPHARRVDHHQPWLTLHGLRLLYHLNAPSSGRGAGGGDPARGATW